MMKCKECGKVITSDIRITRMGYHRKVCRLCINKSQREAQRKKAKLIKESKHI